MLPYWFVLGREPLLSAAEIASVFELADVTTEFSILKAKISELTDSNVTRYMQRLGGTVKIAAERGNQLTEAELLAAITEELKTVDGKIHFGLSLYEKEQGTMNKEQCVDTVYRWGKKIKQDLKENGLSVRHAFNREAVLSSVSVEKNGLTKRGREFLITRSKNNLYSFAKTVAVQPFEAFGARDFGRPGRDDVSGMLPPKLALMMINVSQLKPDQTVLDPFCGSGTILTEAKLLGFKNLIGSDISEKAIEDTKKNLEWVATRNNEQGAINKYIAQTTTPSTEAISRLLAIDSQKLSTVIIENSINVIVTEPYLGKPLKGNETEAALQSQAAELKQLYLNAFSEFYKLLKPGGRIVFIIPRFKTRTGWVRIDCAEEIKKIGFALKPLLPAHDFLLYARSDQRVGREIWRFEKR